MDADVIVKPALLEGLTRTINWYRSDSGHYLRSIFDVLGFKDRQATEPIYYLPPASLGINIRPPSCNSSQQFNKIKREVLNEINSNFDGLSELYLASLNSNQLLFLLEKFSGVIPFDDAGIDAVYDVFKIKAAMRLIEWNQANLGHEGALLINVDLSGIQSFIYGVISTGALKNLRARSFFVELLSNHIVRIIVDSFHLHASNVLMDGGGSVYLLSSCPTNHGLLLYERIADPLNKWLLDNFGGRLHAVFTGVKCSNNDLDGDASSLLKKLTQEVFFHKRRKFGGLLDTGQFPFVEDKDPVYEACEICQRDDPAAGISRVVVDPQRFRCHHCEQLIHIGNRIPAAKYIYHSHDAIRGSIQIQDRFYLLSEEVRHDMTCPWAIYEEEAGFVDRIGLETWPLINRLHTIRVADLPISVRNELAKRKASLVSLRTFTVDEEQVRQIDDEIDSLQDESMATVEHLAASSEGAKLVGALRMDVDNMGRILSNGFYGKVSLKKLSSFSRNMNYFFKLGVTALCQAPRIKLGQPQGEDISSRNAQVIYAGGDDLFLLGAWSDVAEIAIDVGQSFKDYTCGNLDMGLSGGLAIHHSKFPVNKMAEETGRALNVSKDNMAPCWMCRQDWISCPLFDGGNCRRKDSLTLFYTDYIASLKRKLDESQQTPKYQQEPSRLKLALKWKHHNAEEGRITDEIEEYVLKPLISFVAGRKKLGRVFFHNVLSLLNVWYEEGFLYLPRIAWMIQRFNNDLRRLYLNGADDESLLDLYETYLHFFDERQQRFPTLHVPLWWSILLTKEEVRNEDKVNGRKTL